MNGTVPGVVCKPEKTINETLADGFYALYSSDTVVNPKNFTHPFDQVKNNFFFYSSVLFIFN